MSLHRTIDSMDDSFNVVRRNLELHVLCFFLDKYGTEIIEFLNSSRKLGLDFC